MGFTPAAVPAAARCRSVPLNCQGEPTMGLLALLAYAATRPCLVEHANVTCTIQLYSAFTLSATRSGVDQIRARYRLIHQYGALVRNALNDNFLSLPQVYVYVLFTALSW